MVCNVCNISDGRLSLRQQIWKGIVLRNGDFLMSKKLRLNCVKLNLFLLRLKNSERLFIHKSLLFSLGVGSLVFVLDKTSFASREDHPVSEVFIIKYKRKRGYQLRYFASSLFSDVQQLCFFKLKQKEMFQ